MKEPLALCGTMLIAVLVTYNVTKVASCCLTNACATSIGRPHHGPHQGLWAKEQEQWLQGGLGVLGRGLESQ